MVDLVFLNEEGIKSIIFKNKWGNLKMNELMGTYKVKYRCR